MEYQYKKKKKDFALASTKEFLFKHFKLYAVTVLKKKKVNLVFNKKT